MNIVITKPLINPFGGLNFVIDEIKKKGVTTLMDNELSSRPD